jgi:hypothetical protein
MRAFGAEKTQGPIFLSECRSPPGVVKLATRTRRSMELSEAEALVLRKVFSSTFVQSHLRLEKSNLLAAAELYYLGMLLSAELIVPLRVVELTIRSSVNSLMSQRLHARWFADPGHIYREFKWDNKEKSALKRARSDANKEHWPEASAEQLIARTPMNFWVRCFSGKYENQLWHPHLKPLFPDHKVKRRDIHQRLEYLRRVRNRVAHHKLIPPDEGEKSIAAVRYILQNLNSSGNDGFSAVLKLLETSFSTIELRIEEMRELITFRS